MASSNDNISGNNDLQRIFDDIVGLVAAGAKPDRKIGQGLRRAPITKPLIPFIVEAHGDSWFDTRACLLHREVTLWLLSDEAIWDEGEVESYEAITDQQRLDYFAAQIESIREEPESVTCTRSIRSTAGDNAAIAAVITYGGGGFSIDYLDAWPTADAFWRFCYLTHFDPFTSQWPVGPEILRLWQRGPRPSERRRT